MAAVVAKENAYKFSVMHEDATMVSHTNGTTRKLLFRELVCETDANGLTFVGFVASRDGIEAGATGWLDLMEGKEITTDQFAVGAFVAKDLMVYITPQTNSVAAIINVASAVGLIPLKARIISYVETGTLRLRMPIQPGDAIAAT